jgi:NuA3 HAT complex component NTO1
MEPIDGVEAIPKGRWKLICYLCKQRMGACIQCSRGSCYTAYHPSCAREYGLYLRLGTNSGMASADEGAPGPNVSYCDKHTPSASASARQRDLSEDDPPGTPGPDKYNSKKRKLLSYGERNGSPATPRSSTGGGPLLPLPSARLNRAHNKAIAAPLPAPIVPQYIYNKLWEYAKPLRCRQKPQFVRLVCRYWSLKRESRRGAPLLKRLHLEVRSSPLSFIHLGICANG